MCKLRGEGRGGREEQRRKEMTEKQTEVMKFTKAPCCLLVSFNWLISKSDFPTEGQNVSPWNPRRLKHEKCRNRYNNSEWRGTSSARRCRNVAQICWTTVSNTPKKITCWQRNYVLMILLMKTSVSSCKHWTASLLLLIILLQTGRVNNFCMSH